MKTPVSRSGASIGERFMTQVKHKTKRRARGLSDSRVGYFACALRLSARNSNALLAFE